VLDEARRFLSLPQQHRAAMPGDHLSRAGRPRRRGGCSPRPSRSPARLRPSICGAAA
jgi:hypothetical protein